ncbi:DUF5047 domain-containing protein [Nocardia sp.]|uniref:DUF5047 domain-containing protein n=1 Tax=Nocardia sp. TaxID=1821 RepID=UPI002589FBB7|nr:DUF5047 domain-containing protein [Nocardia sp.]
MSVISRATAPPVTNDLASIVAALLSLADTAAPTDPFGDARPISAVAEAVSKTIEELVPMGFFAISEISGDIHEGPLDIVAPGLESLIIAEPLTAPTSTKGYPSTVEFCQSLISAVLPDAVVADESSNGLDAIPTKTWDTDSSRWAALQEAARAVGAEIFVSAAGSFVLRDVPNVELGPTAWDVLAGERGVMVAAERGLSADGVFNRVIVRGENTADNIPPVSGTATLTDPFDPLRYGGPFGRRTKVYRSELIKSVGQAELAAEAILRDALAPNSSVTLSTVPNPALDAGDRIRVVYGAGLDPETHLVQSFALGLDGGAFIIETVSGKAEGPEG